MGVRVRHRQRIKCEVSAVTTTTVINKYHHNNSVPAGAVNIMRGTTFGNPYPIGAQYGDRANVIRLFKLDLWARVHKDPEYAAAVRALHGKTLCCCCAPQPCHGDVLAKAALWLQTNLL